MNNLNQITSKAKVSSELIEQFGGLQNLCNYSNLQELSTKIEYALRHLK